MTVHPHQLGGCAPTPLAFYLKAIGILRLVAEQADPEARGWWRGETFLLATRALHSGAALNYLHVIPWRGETEPMSSRAREEVRWSQIAATC